MKRYLYHLFMLSFATFGCVQEPKDVLKECVGASFYYVDNRSEISLMVHFNGPVLNHQIDTATVIRSQQRILIGQDASFGSIPQPVGTFASFELYTLQGDKKTTVYKQDPVQNALWVRRKHNADDPDFGCQMVDYTLIVTEDMLK
jgi:hypothetical protein